MTWDKIQPPSLEQAKEAAANQKAELVALAKQYHTCFSTEAGKRVLEDLTKRFVYDNNTPLESSNINYVAAYRNGEAGAIKFLIHQIMRAEEI